MLFITILFDFKNNHYNNYRYDVLVLGPDYIEVGCPGRRAGSFAEVGIRLILYAKNCPGKWAHKAECAYVIPASHVTQKEFWKEFLCLLTPTLFQTRV